MVGGVIALMALLMMNTDRISSISFIPVPDRSDYETVAVRFVKKNGFIANKIGKVVSLNHVGRGGESSGKSFNVFRIQGEEKRAVVNMTVTRQENGDWYVTNADILVGGKNLRIPVKRSDVDKFETFKLK